MLKAKVLDFICQKVLEIKCHFLLESTCRLHYTLVYGKGHENLEEEAILGWNYIKQFRRMPDGSIARVDVDVL